MTFRDLSAVGLKNVELNSANATVNSYTLSQTAVAKAVAAQKIREMRALNLNPVDGYTPGIRLDYIYDWTSIPDFPGILGGLSLGMSTQVWAPYYNPTDTYIEVSQLGVVIGEIPPYSVAPQRGINGVDYVVTKISSRIK